MYTVTFYSYKGGVGRTLALMNTAFRLSRKGKAVFILDFDLEAPGVDVFSSRPGDTGGLLEYISEYSRTGHVLPLQNFVSEMHWGTKGNIFCMSAGKRDSEYQRLLAQLNWKEFYSRERGFLFVENLKRAIAAEFSPDYVLIDSRTGMTDVSGICTLQLPDLVVLVFGLNEQNLLGTSHIFNSVTRNPLNRSIKTLLVASPVPDVPEYLGIRKQRLDRARELFGNEPTVVLPFDAFVAFKESISPVELGEYLNAAYAKLCDEIIATNESDIITMLNDARQLQDSGDFRATDSLFRQIVAAHPKNPKAWLDYGNYLRNVGRLEEAIDAYENAERQGSSPRGLRELAATNLFAERYDAARAALRKYLASSKNFRNTLRLAKTFASRDQVDAALEAYSHILASPKPAPEMASALFEAGSLYLHLEEPERAVRYFEQVVKLEPPDLPDNYNLAVALQRSGRQAEAKKFYEKSIEMFEQNPGLGMLPKDEANKFQAMSQAYAAVGNIEKAAVLMRQAISVSESVSPTLYSSFQYREVSPEVFRQESREFLLKLQENLPIKPSGEAKIMGNVYVEARPKGRHEGSPIHDYVVEDHADHELGTFKTQKEAIEWAKKNGHHPLVARVRHLNDKKIPDHWRAA